MLLQIETALDKLSSNDATVEGVLIGVIIMLVSFIVYLLKRAGELENYQREQNKANLEMIGDITNKITNSENNIGEIKDMVNANSSTITEILTIVRERLNKIR